MKNITKVEVIKITRPPYIPKCPVAPIPQKRQSQNLYFCHNIQSGYFGHFKVSGCRQEMKYVRFSQIDQIAASAQLVYCEVQE